MEDDRYWRLITQLNEHVRTQVLTPRCPHLFNTTTCETTHLLLHVLVRSAMYPGATKTSNEKVAEWQKIWLKRRNISGTEVGSCVKSSRIRKAVPPPEDEILLEPLRGELLESFLMPAYINPVQVIRFGPIRTIKNALGLVEYYGPPKSRNPRNPRNPLCMRNPPA